MSRQKQREIGTPEIVDPVDRGGRSSSPIDHATRANQRAEGTRTPDDRTPDAATFNKSFMDFLQRMGCCVGREQLQDIHQEVQEGQELQARGVSATEQRNSDTTTSPPFSPYSIGSRALRETDTPPQPQKELEAVQKAFEEKIRDDSITREDFHLFESHKGQIVDAVESDDSKKIIESVKYFPLFEKLYAQSVHVTKGYTLEVHVNMVLDQLTKYQWQDWDSPLLSRGEIVLVAGLYNLTKPLDKVKCHEHNTHHSRILGGNNRIMVIF